MYPLLFLGGAYGTAAVGALAGAKLMKMKMNDEHMEMRRMMMKDKFSFRMGGHVHMMMPDHSMIMAR